MTTYRVRRGWFGRCILQQQFNTPSLLAGVVNPTVRDVHWADVAFRRAPAELMEAVKK